MTKTYLLALAMLFSGAVGAQTANRYEVVITEIMADPSPVVGLPNAEYIEIRNVSSTSYNLSGWRLSDASSTVTISSALILQPDSAVILCTNSNVAALSPYGRSIGIASFPSLDNDGDVLTLRSPQGRIIHTVSYAVDWYSNDAKNDGGWSLEMIDPKNPCGGKANWKASTNGLGGTPGKVNSVNGANADDTPPQLKRAYPIDSVTIQLLFDEPLDSTTVASVGNYNLLGVTITSATAMAPQFQTVQLKLATPLVAGAVHTITTKLVTDCKGNAIGAYNKTRIAMPQTAAANDVVINEILFNPKSGGSDYVEIYNRSSKTVDVSKLYLANRNSGGVVASLSRLMTTTLLLFPGDYLVTTEDAANLRLNFLMKDEDALLQLTSLPSLPDDKGTVMLVSLNGDIIDELSYKDDWHFGLIDNADGVALERMDPNASTQQKNNWHSAASQAGYGTPGYQNSQYRLAQAIQATVEVMPKSFSPDNDGRDDVATINYAVDEPGYVANVLVFDAAGRLVRRLVKGDLLSLKGSWSWDGLGENRAKLPIGNYVVLVEIFNLDGKRISVKKAVALVRPLS